MALTPAEQEELDRLKAERAALDDDDAGQAHLNEMAKARRPKPVTRPFSFFRMTVGGVRDALQGMIDTLADTGDAVSPIRQGVSSTTLGKSLWDSLGITIPGFRAVETLSEVAAGQRKAGRGQLMDFAGSENAGTAEKVGRGVVSFFTPFFGFSKALGVVRAESVLGRIGLGALAGAATDFSQLDPVGGNMANVLKETFGLSNGAIEALVTDDDDDNLDQRFKAAVSGTALGVLSDAALEAGAKTLRAYKAWRGSLDEANAAVDATKTKMPVEFRPQEQADEAAAGAAGAEKAGKARGKKESVDPFDVSRKKPVEDPEDILDFLRRKAGLNEDTFDEELFSRFAAHLVNGDPANTLAKMGIDPAKLDWSKFDDPGMLGRFHDGLRDVFEEIAKRLGRTGIRVTERQIHLAARAMATTADALKDLFGRTSNLAETLMASRMIVGAHGHRLLSLADAAMKAMKAGDGTKEWNAFLEAFYRHAYFLGALRGAGSEVGRALKSLQMVARVGKNQARATAEEVIKRAEGETASGAKASEMEALSDAVGRMTEPAERLLLLGQVLDKGADLGELSGFVRAKSGSVLKRLDAALGETRGNLFTSATAMLNATSGMAMMGMRAVSKALAGIVRMSMSPFGKQHSLAARRNLLEAWAYTDGALQGWRVATRNTLALLEREGMSEVAINLDGLGMRKLAGEAAASSASGSRKLTGENFERVDVAASARNFAMTAADRRYLFEKIEQWNTPRLMEHSLKFLVRSFGAAANAAGTASRLGTILFINVPDQFIGTMAAKAGAQAQAVRLAAREAADMGLDGAELSKYLKARSIQLTETVDGFADDAYSAGAQETALRHGDAEGHEILFQDDLEFGFARGISRMAGSIPMFHLVVPFVKTPLRILERTAIDYTPLGLLKDRVRRAIMAGGPEGDEALARLGLGMTLTASAFLMADDRTIIGSDGSYKSSARLSRPSYTLKVGDDLIEFNRIDPLGTLLGWGADVRAYLDHQQDNPDANGMFSQLFEAAAWATTANILSKTWLQSLQNLTDLAGVDSEDELSTRWRNYAKTFGARLVPAAGLQKTTMKGLDPFVRETADFYDAALANTFGSEKLPVKRDTLLGRPLEYMESDRLFGAKAGPGVAARGDPVLDELEWLSYDLPAPKKTVLGVRLNASQYSRFLELRGQIVKNPKTGLTLEQAVTELFKLPEYQELPRMGRIKAIRDETRGYTKLATDQLFLEDEAFAKEAVRKETASVLLLEQGNLGQLDAETEKLAQELGLSQ